MNTIRKNFPLFNQYNPALVYLDNAATTQKPYQMVQAMADFYLKTNANVHRGNHRLARQAEDLIGKVRAQVQNLIHACSPEEVIFTKGTTEGLNLVAQAYGQQKLKPGDEVIVSVMEHHSNLLPWQRLCENKRAYLRIAPITSKGHIDLEQLRNLVTPRTKIVAVSYVSNVLGTINPIKEIVHIAHEKGALVVVDAAQATPHLRIDVQELQCDFLAFSAHKMYGPTGIGILYAKKELLETMAPYQVGGGMVQTLPEELMPTYHNPPDRFEAGTQHLAGIVGLGATLQWITQIGYPNIQQHEQKLAKKLHEKLYTLPRVQFVGNIEPEIAMATFNIKGIHPLDVGIRLDTQNIAVRTGLFCAKPLMDALHQSQGAIRVSCAIYNTLEDIDKLITVLQTKLTSM